MIDLSILIINWNTRDLLAQCLTSIYADWPAGDGDFEVIVVDNASADGSAAMMRHCFPQAFLVENDRNAGFAAANNQAIGRSRGRYVLLLNPDTVLQPGALASLVTFMGMYPEAGAAGSMLLNPDGTLQPSCHPFPTLGGEMWRLLHLDQLIPLAVYRMADWPLDRPRAVDSVQGASLIVRREVIDRIGALDESYFMYSEEVDWCLRIRRAGWKIYWVPASRIFHFGGQSTRQAATAMFLQLYRAKVQYFRKHFGAFHGFLYKGELLFASAVRLLLTPVMGVLQPGKRRERAVLARRYGRLILALPRM